MDDPPPNMLEKKPVTLPGIEVTVWPNDELPEEPFDAPEPDAASAGWAQPKKPLDAGALASPSETVEDAADCRLESVAGRVIVAEELPSDVEDFAASAIAPAESPADPALGPGAGLATTGEAGAVEADGDGAPIAGRSGVLPVSSRPAIR